MKLVKFNLSPHYLCASLLAFLLLFSPMGIFAQQDTVTGTVTDEMGQSIIGASVQVKGAQTGSITDIDGNFTVKAHVGNTLVVSYIGYASQEIKVTQTSGVRIILKEDTEMLDEVIVVGYGTSRKGDLTGALSTLQPDANDAAKSVSLSNLLNGKVAGLVVNSSSAMAGSASSIQIRGASSLRGDNQPLYVIDNVPMASAGEFASSAVGGGDFQINQDPLASLNPADIEDITILKDASSTAIYGSRGANGVILITTKKGRQGKAKVNVSANFTIAEPSKLMDMMNLQEYAGYRNSRINNEEYPFYVVGDEVRYVFSDALANYDPNNPETYNIVNYRNWQKEIYRSAFSQNYSVSLSGGSDKVTYYISANFKDINGTVKQTGLQQGDLRANLGFDLSKKVHLNMTMSGSIRQNDMMAGGGTLGGSTTAISRTALDYAPFLMPSNDPSLSGENTTTVLSWLNDYVDVANDKTFSASVDLRWQIIDGLSYNFRAGGNLNTNDRKRWYGMQLYQGMNNNGLLAISDLDKSNINVENLLNYTKDFNELLHLDATVGVTYDQYKFLNANVRGTQFSTFDLRENGLHMAGNIVHDMPVQKDYQLLSYLGRINLSFLDKYLISASIRADGSSKFAKGNRWGYFPSASIAWRMEQEDFMKDIEWLHQLKVRASYGMTGNQSIDPYFTFSTYAGNNTQIGDGQGSGMSSLIISNLPNDGLTWEKTSSWNVGIDFGLFNSRLSGTLDIYMKKTNDLLILRDLPGSAGFGSTYYNQGSLDNKGVEFSLNAQIIDKGDWQWSVSANIGKNKNKITDLGLEPTTFGCLGERIGYYGNSLGDHFGTGNIFLEGEAPGLFLGLATQGIVQEEDLIRGEDGNVTGVKYIRADGTIGEYQTVNGTTPKAGDVKFIDQNNDGTIDTNDRTIIGNPNPGFTYGFQTSLSWKSLTLSMAFNGVHDRDVINTNNRYINMPSQNTGNLTKEAYHGMWTPENHSNLYPSSTYQLYNGIVYDRYVEDASYLRCSDITLNWSLPKNWMKKIGFQNISVFASVKNAFIITDYSGYDPEVNSFAFDGLRPGIDMSSYPTPRQYIFGLNVTF